MKSLPIYPFLKWSLINTWCKNISQKYYKRSNTCYLIIYLTRTLIPIKTTLNIIKLQLVILHICLFNSLIYHHSTCKTINKHIYAFLPNQTVINTMNLWWWSFISETNVYFMNHHYYNHTKHWIGRGETLQSTIINKKLILDHIYHFLLIDEVRLSWHFFLNNSHYSLLEASCNHQILSPKIKETLKTLFFFFFLEPVCAFGLR